MEQMQRREKRHVDGRHWNRFFRCFFRACFSSEDRRDSALRMSMPTPKLPRRLERSFSGETRKKSEKEEREREIFKREKKNTSVAHFLRRIF